MKNIEQTKTSTNKPNTHGTAMRFSSQVTSTLKSEVSKLNKLKKGSKKVSASDILEALIPLLDQSIRQQIIAKTVTSNDRQRVAFESYTKKNKNVNRDDFLDLIQYGEINIDDYLPEEMKRRTEATLCNKVVQKTQY